MKKFLLYIATMAVCIVFFTLYISGGANNSTNNDSSEDNISVTESIRLVFAGDVMGIVRKLTALGVMEATVATISTPTFNW